jgi:hypothetical protein
MTRAGGGPALDSFSRSIIPPGTLCTHIYTHKHRHAHTTLSRASVKGKDEGRGRAGMHALQRTRPIVQRRSRARKSSQPMPGVLCRIVEFAEKPKGDELEKMKVDTTVLGEHTSRLLMICCCCCSAAAATCTTRLGPCQAARNSGGLHALSPVPLHCHNDRAPLAPAPARPRGALA